MMTFFFFNRNLEIRLINKEKLTNNKDILPDYFFPKFPRMVSAC